MDLGLDSDLAFSISRSHALNSFFNLAKLIAQVQSLSDTNASDETDMW